LSDFFGSRFVACKKTVVVKSLLKKVEAIQETLTMKIVKDGFAITGQYPIDFRKGMNLCPTVKVLSKAPYEKIRDSVETLASIFREREVLTEADMDGEGIVNMLEESRKTRKDERVLYQQRPAVMNR
jgi:hypothetical protein